MADFYAQYPVVGTGGGGGGGGTVTSVALTAPASILSVTGSPVTTAGTLALSLTTQSANLVWAGPTTGSAATPTFRSLVAADLPLAFGNLTDAGTDGIVVNGGTGAVIGSGTSLAQHVADATHNGYLSSTDWSTFNGKQASGNYITALTGDGTASGPGSAALTLATVNSNVGSFGGATAVGTFTVNGKGLVTAAGSTSIQIAESQVTNLVSDLAGKEPTITVLTPAHGGTGVANNNSSTLTISGSFGTTLTITGTTTATLQQTTGVIVGRTTTDTLTNKTLTTPIVNGLILAQTAKTSNYALLTTDWGATGDSSGGSFTFTLPAATGNSGTTYSLKKVDSSFNAITVTDGTFSTTLNSLGESLLVQSDGVTYQILSRYIPSLGTSYTPTVVGFGTVSGVSAFYQRVGGSMNVWGSFVVGSSTSVTATISVPSGLTLGSSLDNGATMLGNASAVTSSGTPRNTDNYIVYQDSGTSTSAVLIASTTASNKFVANLGNSIASSGWNFSFQFTVPISGWNG